MHVLPLPFGMALALLLRRDAQQLAKPKAVRGRQTVGAARDLSLPETRYAALRQIV
jgi:hypothetical protein